MTQLLTISDVRNFRQLGKQVNADNFTARVKEVQDNQLCELMGSDMYTDFSTYIDDSWNTSSETFVRNSYTQMTATNVDLSSWVGYGLRINSTVFVTVESATFGGTDTIIIVSGYDLPETLTTTEYKTESKYLSLLNGADKNTNGLRGFMSWHLLNIYLLDGDLKQSDVGNVKFTGELFDRPSFKQKNTAGSGYLQNATREENKIIEYLNDNSIDFPLWSVEAESNLNKYDFVII